MAKIRSSLALALCFTALAGWMAPAVAHDDEPSGAATTTAAATQPPRAWFGPQKPPYKVETPIALTGGTLIDATGAPARTGQTVLIEGGKIKAVGPDGSIAIPADARQFDARGMTIMPGLINSNQHIQLNGLYPAPAADLPIAELRAR